MGGVLGGVVVESVDGVAGGDDGGWLVDGCERFANRLADLVVVGWGSEADAEDGDLFGQVIGEERDGDADGVVGLFPDGGSGEGELIGLRGVEDGLGEFLVGCVLEGQSGVAEAFEVSVEVGGEDVEAVESDDAVGRDEQEALDLEVT